MSVINDSTVEVLLVHQQIFQVAMTEGRMAKVSFVMLMSLFFIYLNAIMVYTLWIKTVFKETPCYILFKHMLFNNLIHLFVTSLLYIFSVAYLRLVMAACAFLVLVSGTTFRNAPLILALMSLKTVLLHLIQLGLCLTYFLFSIIARAAAMASNNSSLFMDLHYLNYVVVLFLPRCLSPLIYGLRDDAVRPLFRQTYDYCQCTLN